MNTKGKIVVALAVMMVAAAMVVPAVMGDDVEYSATVLAVQDTVICTNPALNGTFGDVLVGQSRSINPSFALKNTGGWDAIIEAAFNTNGTGAAIDIYGLVGTDATNVIPGTAVALKAVGLIGAKTYLTTDGSDTVIPPNLPDDGVCYNYDAHLDVPGSAVADTYTGNVVLSFSNA
ncbi:hypothetical protein C5S31_01050 [ANME-1 cluster archaeon GoMg2]|nr:hypothetical protein [ANME-1 cluster archaeon GoMg2]